MLPPILTIGSAVRDVFLLSKDFQIIRSPQFSTGYGECVSLGAKIDLDELVLTTGGGATNAAVTFARLGFPTRAFAKVGNDENGHAILNDLQDNGVDPSGMMIARKGQTGYSTLLTAPNGERTALVYRGVSQELKSSDIPAKHFTGGWAYVSSLGGNIELLDHILKSAARKKMFVALNPGNAELAKSSAVKALLPHVRVLILNLEEAQKLTGKSTKDGIELAKSLADVNRIAIVTDGAKGAYAAEGKKTWFVQARTITSVSRTGAGDAFGSGVVAALAADKPIEEALAHGTLNAESVIQHIGAKAGILRAWPKEKELAAVKIVSR